MFIETENTPNPATIKFLPGCEVAGSFPSADFTEQESAKGKSELAEELFDVTGVRRVFLGRDFISVTKDDAEDWAELRPVILSVITDFFESSRSVLTHMPMHREAGEEPVETDPADQEIVTQICDLIETRVRPAVAADGGDIVFRGYKDGVVFLLMQGACSGCPSAGATLRHGVEAMLRHYVPEVKAVEQVIA